MTTSQNPTSSDRERMSCDRCDFLNESHRPNVPPVEESYSSLASKVFAPFANGIKPSGPPAYEAVKNWNYHDGVEVPVDESYSPRHAKKTPLVGKLRDLLAAWKTEHPVEQPTMSKQFVERDSLRAASSNFEPSWISRQAYQMMADLLSLKALPNVPVDHYLGAVSFCSGIERDVEEDTYELIVVMTATYAPVSSVPGVDE